MLRYSCYYTSTECKYFMDGECYENYTVTRNSSSCRDHHAGYFLNGRCYYRVPQTCSRGHHLVECACYAHRSSIYTNDTCQNIGGFYTNNYCYYVEFNCSGHAVNDQCYSTVWAVMLAVYGRPM